jgi:DNA-binding MarR family transcriptional regulator
MEEDGIIRKVQGEEDKRQVMIYLTDKGKVLKKQAKHIVKGFNKKILEQIPEEKLETFIEVLNEINIISETNHLTT